MTNLDRQLHDHLQASASALKVPPGNLEGVVARTRTRRRRQGLAAITAVTLFAGAVTGIALARSGDHHPVTVAAAGASAAPAPPRAGDVGLVWQKVDPHSALGYTNSITAGGSLYALSTAPGVTDPTTAFPGRQIYRSTDGVNWATAAGPADAFISDLAASGDQLYAVGTGAATAPTAGSLSSVVVDGSPDRGANWHQVRLPIDVSAIQAGTLGGHNQTVHVAANAKGVLVVAQMAGDLDVTKFLPPGVTAPHGWVLTADGVDLLGAINNPACPAGMTDSPPGRKGPSTTVAPVGPFASGGSSTPGPVPDTTCWSTAAATSPKSGPTAVIPALADHAILRSFTWAQLGVSGDLLQAAQGQPFVFFSADGKTFHSVAIADLPRQTFLVQVATSDDSFVLAANSTQSVPGVGQEFLWQSADGVSWAATPAPPADQAGPSAVGYLAGRLTLVSGDTLTGPSIATLGPGGWSESSLTSLVGPTSAGAEVSAVSGAVGPFGVAVVVMVAARASASSSGNIAVTRPSDPSAPSAPETSLLVSRDGVTWSHENLSQLAGGPVDSVASLVVTANRFIVTAQLPIPRVNSPAPETVLVATAR